MEIYTLNKDVKVICVQAKKFPEGIKEAFQKLERLDPSICERPFYGISYKIKKEKSFTRQLLRKPLQVKERNMAAKHSQLKKENI